MQFHLNGFKPGGLTLRAPDDSALATRSLPDEADVLIVGCGPAGLTLAAQLAAFPDIRTLIVDQKPGRLTLGQADGVACRTMEMFEAFGFSERVLAEAYWVNEVTFWKPDPAQRQNIVRSGRVQDVEDGLSEFPHVILNQARIHDFLLDAMRSSDAALEPHYGRRLASLDIDSAGHYPVTARLEGVNSDREGEIETVKARFVVGCDGARSTVRKAIGQTLRGDSANQAWGVMDVLAVTDFPDVRCKSVIHSASQGSALIIPREGGYLFRLYIELDKLNPDERIANRNLTPDHLIAAAGRILHPYRLEVKEVAWWSVYEIGQRLCDRFDNAATDDALAAPSVFIAGDACHTHSPKAGQGMNVSMGDGFNLGWKLAAVLQGRSPPALLHTYSEERQALAKELIDFDREIARMFSAPPKDPDDPSSEGLDPAEFQRFFTQHGRFTAGTAVHYAPSMIIGEASHQHLARGFSIGSRFHSASVIRQADARPMQLGHVVKADGRWRLFAFADAEPPTSPKSGLARLRRFLANHPASPIVRYTRRDADLDSVIDIRAVLQQGFRDVETGSLGPLLLPAKGRYGLADYEKVFCADQRPDQDIFNLRGIDRRGCIVVVRPDQYIAAISPLDGYDGLAEFFSRVLVEP
ncbi:MAG: 3-hydroxybenzoate 4-monooxygenase [Caulobacteraceae bacterium]|nr:3-hydroxybenzoate 4-monooxygenase [Caulobacteraceae bacterium]